MARTVFDRLGECLKEPAQLALAADERRVEPAGKRGRPFVKPEQAARSERLALALQLERGLLRLDGIAHQACRLRPEENLAAACRLLEAGGDVDGIAGCEPLRGADDDLAGVDANPRLDAELRQRVPHLDRGSQGTQRIVFVELRHAEDGHHRIADELLNGAAVPLDNRLHLVEVAPEERAQRLRVDRFAQRGRTDDVAEKDGYDLAVLARGGLRRPELGAAGVAEA